MTREIVLDTETTGLEAQSGDRIVEIGCVELVNHIPTGANFHAYINPGRDMPEGAFRVHGLSEEFLRDKPRYSEIASEFVNFLDHSTLIIHNAPFDIGFLHAEHDRAQLPRLDNEVIDTVSLARKVHPGARVSLDALCKHYGIDTTRRALHGALLDSEILAEVYLELIGGRQVGLALGAIDGASGWSAGEPTRRPAAPRPVPLPSRLTPRQRQAHAELVKSLGKEPLWALYDDPDAD